VMKLFQTGSLHWD